MLKRNQIGLFVLGMAGISLFTLLLLTPSNTQANPQKEAQLETTLSSFYLTSHTPVTHAIGIAVDSDITATFDTDLAEGSVVSTSFAAHTQFGGLLTGTLSVTGDTITLNPNRDLFAGEQVQVIATTDISSTGGMSLTNPTQWGFKVGPVTNRCVDSFSDMGAGLSGVYTGGVAWGDYDNDGDLDILLTGYDGVTRVAKVYQNNDGIFSDIGAGLTGVYLSSVAWGDYDNDGDLDILLTGRDVLSNRVAKVYQNNAGSFSDIGAGLTGVQDSSVAWGDYDNDGDLDILLTGEDSGGNRVAKVYQNNAGSFSDIGAGLTAVRFSSVAWGDYDNDGDLDILLTGEDSGSNPVAKVYQNNAGIFSDIGAGLTGVRYGSVAWGDYDNDGDLDILLTGWVSGGTRVATLYQNNAGIFSDMGAGLTAVRFSSVAWGDYDNDGDLDILLTGEDNGGNRVATVYQNKAGTFSESRASLTGVSLGSVAWGDYDNDGDLDILLTGLEGGYVAKVYRNNDCLNLISYTPSTNAIGVVVDTDITAVLEADVATASVVSTSFAAHTGFGGLLTGTLSVSGDTITLNPNRDLFAGEQVQVIATADISSTVGMLTKPTQWGFTAGPVTNRCAAGFSDMGVGLTGVWQSDVAWGDYDNDGDLDILLTGLADGNIPVTKVYQNNAGSFSDIGAGLTGVYLSSVAWGDYDNDGDLDILLTGGDNGNIPVAKVYQNNAGSFSAIGAGLTGVQDGSVAWGDYDNDGDLDILLTGAGVGGVRVAKVYQNNAGSFSAIGVGLTGVGRSSVAWGDYDNDGDLDILLTGEGVGGGYVAKVYQNNAGSFTDIGAGLTGVQYGSVAWGDYDNDGDLDILLTGWGSGSSAVAKMYQNNAGTFTAMGAGLTEVWQSDVAWGDYDNDGDLDILLTGWDNGYSGVAKVYENNAGTFTDRGVELTGIGYGSVAWGDYDNDGDLDISLTGWDNGSMRVAKVYRNDDCFNLTSHTPVTHALGVAVDTDITAIFETDVAPASVVSRSFAAHTGFGGLLTGTLSVTGNTITLNPNRDLFAGEQVQVIATADINSTDGLTLDPTQWGFTAGPVINRCVGGFTESVVGLTGVWQGSVAWGDYDNDGDLDILLTGWDSLNNRMAKVYQNNAGVFADIGAGLTGVQDGSVAWGDYDNDGDLDILLSGENAGISVAKVYQNNVGVFADIGAGLTGVQNSSVAWGDYDNDGDLDILLTGWLNGGIFVAKVYQNNAGMFSDIGAGLTGVYDSSVAWGDYDNDGDLDILLTGWDSGSNPVAKVYQNDFGTFTDIGAGLTGVRYSSVAWGDYDKDGDLDILLTGLDSGNIPVAKVYQNNAGSFSDIGAGLTGVQYSSVAWGDYDNDGDLDILLTGYVSGNNHVAKVYENDAGTFIDMGAGLTGVAAGSVAWGDYDNDGDLDILLTGYDSGNMPVAKVYRNGDCLNLTSHTPVAHAMGVAVDTDITATFDAAVATASVVSRSFAAHTGFGGLLTGTLSVTGDTITLNPNRDLFVGEQVQVIATADINGTGGSILTPTQWGFTVGSVTNRCVGGFTESTVSLTGVRDGGVAWGDYDNDGDLDILLTGRDSLTNRVAKVYQNNAGSFTDSGVGLAGVDNGSVAWGDYDNDGDLDILLTGLNAINKEAKVYQNNAGVFADIGAGLAGVNDSSVAWGDYDNDGDLDILLAGWDSGGGSVAKVYQNNVGMFTDIGAGLAGARVSSVAWGDYDNDGDLDILLTGLNGGNDITKVYQNNAGIFTDIGAGLPGVFASSVAWGDYDNDGDLDILLTGWASGIPVAKVYQNNAGMFSDIGAGLTGVYESSVAWGDYDNDGDLDILLTGLNGSNEVAKVYENNAGIFTDIGAGLAGVSYGSVAWGDYDNDGDLDILLAGWSGSNRVATVYRNEDCAPDVQLAKEVDPAVAFPGDTITYTLTFTNTGSLTATNLTTINDNLPTEFAVTNISSNVAVTQTNTGNSYQWQVGDLGIGDGGIITMVGTLVPTATTFANSATITHSLDADPTNNVGLAHLTIPTHLTIIKEAQPKSTAPVTFTLTSDPVGVSETFTLFDDGTDMGNSYTISNSITGIFTLAEQINGQWRTSQIVCDSNQAGGDVTVNDTPVIAFSLDESEQMVCIVHSEQVVNVAISQEITDTVVISGQVVSLIFIADNVGLLPANNVVVSTTIPATILNPVATSSHPITATGGVTYAWSLGTLGPGNRIHITVTGVVSSAAGTIINSAIITAIDDAYLDNNSANLGITTANTGLVAFTDRYVLPQDSSLSVTLMMMGVMANDLFDANLPRTISLVSDVDHGVLALNANGTFVYTPTIGYVGWDHFTYEINNFFNSDVGTVRLRVDGLCSYNLTADVMGADVPLVWQDLHGSPTSFELYRHSLPYFDLGDATQISSGFSLAHTDEGVLPATDLWVYKVHSIGCTYPPNADSAEIGVFSFGIMPGN
ncbi:MAG TPA: FG-GAP-like repeat-containing protein [Anaerolineae bacterium]|nr:FG-GAP-like repeat-containing protein [Anaerolineae bacterium]